MSGADEHRSSSDAARDRTGAVGIVLAAGAGSRFAGRDHKLLVALAATTTRPAETVVARCVAAAATAVRDGDLDALIVVTGAADVAAPIGDVAASLGVGDRIELVANPRWADGQATSLRTGLNEAERHDAEVAVIGLADQPDILPTTWTAVARAACAPNASPISVATYDDRPRNPVAIHRRLWPELPTEGDEGARRLVRVRPDLVTRVPSAGSPADIDTVEDLRRWQST